VGGGKVEEGVGRIKENEYRFTRGSVVMAVGKPPVKLFLDRSLMDIFLKKGEVERERRRAAVGTKSKASRGSR